MDKKELNDLIDRVVLTGPGGVDRIKKILKEIANGSESGGSDSGCQCLAPMIVEGTFDGAFTPNDGQPTFAEAKERFLAGGTLLFKYTDSGSGFETMTIVVSCVPDALIGSSRGLIWENLDSASSGGQSV